MSAWYGFSDAWALACLHACMAAVATNATFSEPMTNKDLYPKKLPDIT